MADTPKWAKYSLGGGLAGLMGFYDSKTTNYDPYSAYSPEQLKSVKSLESLASTGSGGGINLGEAYGGSLGNYDTTPYEQSGLAQLLGQQPTNASLTQAQDVFSKLAGSSFDSSTLDPFMKAAQRAAREGGDILNRDAAVTGSRFGTAILGEKANLSENIQNNIQQKLAELFMNQQNVSLQGAQGLTSVGGMQADMGQRGLENLFNFGTRERDLANRDAQAKFNEFTRQRNEELSRIGMMENIKAAPMGNIETTTPSLFNQLFTADNISSVLKIASRA